jgi:hypothetical protein
MQLSHQVPAIPLHALIVSDARRGIKT